jgi:hypothetical protein
MTIVAFPVFEVLTGLSAFILWFLLPSWVYIDARERDVKNAFRWAILTVVTFGFAWAIYLIARPETPGTFHCPECIKELNGTKAFCPYCGFDLSQTFCAQCQYPLKPEWQVCPSCGSGIKENPIKKEKTAEK